MKTLDQKRADFALQKVTEYLNKLSNKEQKKEFKSFLAGLPSMILQNGFGIALVFMLSKNKENEKTKQKEVFDQIKEWLSEKSDLTKIIFKKVKNKNPEFNIKDDKEFLKSINQVDQSDYRVLQKETLAILEWIKRYAAAFVIEEEEENE